MDKHTRNYLISIAVFGLEALVILFAGPENPVLRQVMAAAIVVTIPFVLVNAWKSAPERRARREAAATAAAE